jgi:hypothetical protein
MASTNFSLNERTFASTGSSHVISGGASFSAALAQAPTSLLKSTHHGLPR